MTNALKGTDDHAEIRPTSYTIDFCRDRDDPTVDHASHQVHISDHGGRGNIDNDSWSIITPKGVYNWVTGSCDPLPAFPLHDCHFLAGPVAKLIGLTLAREVAGIPIDATAEDSVSCR